MISAQKLLDAWYGKGVGTFRVKSVAVPKFSREMGEAVLAHLLINGYLQEDFHFTPYTTISYLKRGRNTDISYIFQFQCLKCLKLTCCDVYHLRIICCNVSESSCYGLMVYDTV